jgi:uncharacterized protein YggU (UPF0235/DUF167 family)
VIAEHPDGVVVDVWVVPGSSRDRVGGVHDDALRVWTTAPASGGAANRAVERLVAAAVGGGRGRLLTGGRGRRKRVQVNGVDAATARARLEASGSL